MIFQSLDGRRQNQRLVLFYKIINGLASVETEDILTSADPVQGRITASNSNTSRQIVIHIGTLFFQPLFRAGSWNNLPFGIEKVDSVEVGKVVSIFKLFFIIIFYLPCHAVVQIELYSNFGSAT